MPEPTAAPDPTPTPTAVPGTGPSGDSVGAGAVAEAALACTGRRLVLVDVVRHGRRVLVQGAAQPSLAGRTVRVLLTPAGAEAGRAVVSSAGLFALRASLPAARLRGAGRARYVAAVDGARSEALALDRRMRMDASTTGARVTLAGSVARPWPAAARPIVIEPRLACGRYEPVATVRARANGRFRARLELPHDPAGATVFRARTQVPPASGRRTLAPTFTLPRIVAP
jgi:hypothetical protein